MYWKFVPSQGLDLCHWRQWISDQNANRYSHHQRPKPTALQFNFNTCEIDCKVRIKQNQISCSMSNKTKNSFW